MIKAIIDKLKNAESIGILSHIHADGDALGSQLALAEALKAMGKDPVCYNFKRLPQNMGFLPGYPDVRSPAESESWPSTMISVDCGSLERCGLEKRPEQIECWINIDHHIGNDHYGDINLVRPEAAATCEIIADMFGEAALEMTPAIATCLFTGLSTDTGSFKYGNTSAHTFSLAAALKEAGADTDLIRLNVYESMGRRKFAMMQRLFYKTRFSADGKIASTAIGFQEAESISPGETGFSGIVAQLKEIEGVEVAMLIRELSDGSSKVSLRSKDAFDCNAFVRSYGGGGHARAAGVTLDQEWQSLQKKLEEALFEALEQA